MADYIQTQPRIGGTELLPIRVLIVFLRAPMHDGRNVIIVWLQQPQPGWAGVTQALRVP